jgi:hypothetical protein
MKKLIGFAVILVALFLSNNVFAQDLVIEVHGDKYQVAKGDISTPDSWTYNGVIVACHKFEEEGKRGWRMPTIEELRAMYEQLYKRGIGNFTAEHYWSSTESAYSTKDLGMAWDKVFKGNTWEHRSYDGEENTYPTAGTANARCIKKMPAQ